MPDAAQSTAASMNGVAPVLAEWQAAGGYQRSEWDEFKVDLAGSMNAFAKLEDGANTRGRYYVHDA